MADVKLSAAEALKTGSRFLRGTLAEELANDAAEFSKPATGVLKFHGVYQQDDRDLRKAGPKSYSLMVRVSVPGGTLDAEQYLAIDALADNVGDGTLRVTSRGGVQYHYVGKRDVKGLMQALYAARLSTFAACGDVVRNVVCCAAPIESAERQLLDEYVRQVNRELKPKTGAYAEVWLDGEKAVSWEASEESEPLYGTSYLPRKFKIGFAYEGENTTDIYSHDLGFVAHFAGGRLEGFTVLAGGGMGQTNGIKGSYPRAADPVAFIEPEQVLEVAKAAVTIHRDFGNRSQRKLARLKYVIQDRGVEWFREELAARLGHALAPPRELAWRRHVDYLDWHRQDATRWFYGLRVVSGRLTPEGRAAVREVVRTLGCEVRLSAQQNLMFTGLTAQQQPLVDGILARHGLRRASELPPVLRHSMACPALPTCGLALTESERVLPDVAGTLQDVLDAEGLGRENVQVRMTGCPNGCARPYTAEVGIVGQSPGLYSIYLGGSPMATRVGELFTHNVKQQELGEALRPLFAAWRQERLAGEAFGDFCHRLGAAQWKERFAEVARG